MPGGTWPPAPAEATRPSGKAAGPSDLGGPGASGPPFSAPSSARAKAAALGFRLRAGSQRKALKAEATAARRPAPSLPPAAAFSAAAGPVASLFRAWRPSDPEAGPAVVPAPLRGSRRGRLSEHGLRSPLSRSSRARCSAASTASCCASAASNTSNSAAFAAAAFATASASTGQSSAHTSGSPSGSGRAAPASPALGSDGRTPSSSLASGLGAPLRPAPREESLRSAVAPGGEATATSAPVAGDSGRNTLDGGLEAGGSKGRGGGPKAEGAARFGWPPPPPPPLASMGLGPCSGTTASVASAALSAAPPASAAAWMDLSEAAAPFA
mmetsp:Transcript_31569/g.70959  ORF Transcript_31569/g.70959 Transcript_31569/m.70959 type:complete len:326 (-) Transcript_31569:1143-2120(-)